jgi:late competence protein required for DNA uptake (superfamily II DNA/RNA helicase)
MATINYMVGDALKHTNTMGRVYVCHCVNTHKLWGSGFVLAINKISDEPRNRYLKWSGMLGDIQTVDIDDMIIVNMMAQKNVYPMFPGFPPVRYEALYECFLRLEELLREGDVVSLPRIACDRGGASWSKVEKIISKALATVNNEIYVYDLPGPTTYNL